MRKCVYGKHGWARMANRKQIYCQNKAKPKPEWNAKAIKQPKMLFFNISTDYHSMYVWYTNKLDAPFPLSLTPTFSLQNCFIWSFCLVMFVSFIIKMRYANAVCTIFKGLVTCVCVVCKFSWILLYKCLSYTPTHTSPYTSSLPLTSCTVTHPIIAPMASKMYIVV